MTDLFLLFLNKGASCTSLIQAACVDMQETAGFCVFGCATLQFNHSQHCGIEIGSSDGANVAFLTTGVPAAQ